MEPSYERVHRLQQEKHQLQAALKHALRWIAHHHTTPITHCEQWKESKRINVIKTILSQHHILDSQINLVLQLISAPKCTKGEEHALSVALKSIIRQIQTTHDSEHTADHALHLVQSSIEIQEEVSHLWKVNAQLWEENQRILSAAASDNEHYDPTSKTQHSRENTQNQQKLRQLIREKTQLIEQLAHFNSMRKAQWPKNENLRAQLSYLRTENLVLLQKIHQASTRAIQLESVLKPNLDSWVSIHDHLPPISDYYWISTDETVRKSLYNAALEVFEDSPGGMLPKFWMPILPPCPPCSYTQH